MEAIAVIHSLSSSSPFVKNQLTFWLLLVPIAITVFNDPPGGRAGLAGILPAYCPAAIRSGDSDNLTPPSGDPPSLSEYQASRLSEYSTTHTSFQLLPYHLS